MRKINTIMDKYSCSVLSAVFFLSCNQDPKSEGEVNKTVKSEPQVEILETSKPENTLKNSSKSSISGDSSIIATNDYEMGTDTLEKFLTNPLDLQDFKKVKGQSNSGGYNYQEHLFKPDYDGFYIHYLIFPKFREHGPRIVAYRKGNDFGDFFEDRDTLIQLFSDRPDKDLKNADLVSKNINEIKRTFGGDYLTDGNFIYYTNNKIKTVLTICTGKSQKVLWFKITRLKKSINSVDDIPQNIRDINAR